MPEIQAFPGIRYDLGHVGALSDVAAPPYDVIGPELQDELYKKHPCNIVRLILNRIEPADDDASNNRYTRAARFFKNWRQEGVLFTETDPAIYVYHQEFTDRGETHVRRGFMARMRLSRFGEGQVFPHEETMAGPKADRLMLTACCQANFSPIFGLFPDEAGEADAVLDQAIAPLTPIVATDHLGVVHRLWPVTDGSAIAAVAAIMGPKPIFIADGHHRYETACNYRDQVYDSGFLSPAHPANYVLMMCVAMEDPGLIIQPTHRLFRGLPEMDSDELAEKLGDCFELDVVGEEPDMAHGIWEEMELEDEQGTIAIYTRKDNRWTIARITDEGIARMAEVAKDHGDAWRGLGVALLHRLVIADRLGATDLPKPTYVHLVEEVVEELKTGEYPLAALVMPAQIEHVREISLSGERMPAKSTYFYPKLLSGLVINPLE
ncbi:MAG: DUF1015 domain-containing protein [Planctomycetota bacterium]